MRWRSGGGPARSLLAARTVVTLAVLGVLMVTAGLVTTYSTLLVPAARAVPVAPAVAVAPCVGGAVQVVAHTDDDLLFLSPDLLHDIQAGRCVRTVYLTAGDAGRGEGYWLGREDGIRAAYAHMAGAADQWTLGSVVVAEQQVLMATLDEDPGISLVFLRLPDGNRTGGGTPATEHQSLMRLWDGTIPELRTIDGSARYTAEALTRTLTALLLDATPPTVRTLDWTIDFRRGDSADHTAAAHFARLAVADYPSAHTLLGYGGYPIWTRSPNVVGTDRQDKASALVTYGGHDALMCLRPWCPDALVCSLRVARQYVVASESAGNSARGDGVLVTASSQVGRQTAQKAVDGYPHGSPVARDREWVANGGAGSWLEIAFPEPTPINGVVLHDRPGLADQITGARLHFSDGTYETIGPLPNNGSALTVAFPARVTTTVRLEIVSVSASTTHVGLAEIETYATMPG